MIQPNSGDKVVCPENDDCINLEVDNSLIFLGQVEVMI